MVLTWIILVLQADSVESLSEVKYTASKSPLGMTSSPGEWEW